ncbi:MAG: hypothetical protein ACI81C_003935 [Alteromonas macleodii]|jgi:hypothetical protein
MVAIKVDGYIYSLWVDNALLSKQAGYLLTDKASTISERCLGIKDRR